MGIAVLNKYLTYSATLKYSENGGDIMTMNKERNYFRAEVFAERLRAERKKRGISQKKLAEAIGRASGSYISNIEIHRNIPSIDSAFDIANALGIPLGYLCDQEVKDDLPVTLGDIARTLMVLYYLDGVTMDVRQVKSEIEKDENGEPVIKDAMIIKVEPYMLREFLKDYRSKVTNPRQRYNKFLKWIKDEIAELDAQSAWDHRNDKRWNKNLKESGSNIYPQDLFQQLIWNHTNDLDAMMKELDLRSAPPKT